MSGQGWQACDDKLALTGWTQARRVVVMRRAIKGELAAQALKAKRACANAAGAQAAQQTCLQFDDDRNAPARLWEYVVLVTNTSYDARHVGQIYRCCLSAGAAPC